MKYNINGISPDFIVLGVIYENHNTGNNLCFSEIVEVLKPYGIENRRISVALSRLDDLGLIDSTWMKKNDKWMRVCVICDVSQKFAEEILAFMHSESQEPYNGKGIGD